MELKKYFDLDKLLKFSKIITICSLILASFSVLGSFFYAVQLNKKWDRNFIYVIDGKGQAFAASIIDNELSYRKPELNDFLIKFHNLFYNIDQNNYSSNTERALNLIGESGKNLFITLDKQGWYSSLKLNNLRQQITIDCLWINDQSYPYKSYLKGLTTVVRIGDDQKYQLKKKIEIECSLINVSRTMSNPHGLMIDYYNIVKHE